MPIYMKYEGIQGTGTGKYNGWIELESCKFDHHGIPVGKSAADIFVTKSQDVASPQLFGESVLGEGKKVTIDFVKDGESVPYLSIELENVMISSYQIGRNSGSDKPAESLSLNFTKISFSYKPTKPSNDPKHIQQKATWNFAIQNSRYS